MVDPFLDANGIFSIDEFASGGKRTNVGPDLSAFPFRDEDA
jgi:hypothetical protein